MLTVRAKTMSQSIGASIAWIVGRHCTVPQRSNRGTGDGAMQQERWHPSSWTLSLSRWQCSLPADSFGRRIPRLYFELAPELQATSSMQWPPRSKTPPPSFACWSPARPSSTTQSHPPPKPCDSIPGIVLGIPLPTSASRSVLSPGDECPPQQIRKPGASCSQVLKYWSCPFRWMQIAEA